MKKIALTTLGVLFAFVSLAGDLLILNNEMIFEGEVKKVKNCIVVFKAEGTRYKIPAIDISSIHFEDTTSRAYQQFGELAETRSLTCLNGKSDAKNFHGKKAAHFLLGAFFGPFAIVGTLVSSPTPHRGSRTIYLSNSKNQFNDPEYLKCYSRKAKEQLIGMELLGWTAWIIFAYLYLSG